MNRAFVAAVGGVVLTSFATASWGIDPRFQHVQPGFYVSGQVGATFLEDADNVGGGFRIESEHDVGFGITGALGWDFGDGVRVEGELGYRQNDIDKLNITTRPDFFPGAGQAVVDADGDVSAFSFMANIFYDFEIGMPLKPYFGGGIGGARLSVNDAAARIGGVSFDLADDSDTVFAWQVGAGLGYPINPWTTIGLDYRYFATQDPEFSAVDESSFDSEYRTHNVSLGLRFRF